MPWSTDIRLPKTITPIFPDRCVACGMPSPGRLLRVGTNAIGWWTLAFWTFGARFTVEVPACDPCKKHMIFQRWFRLAVFCLFVVIGVGVASYLLGSFQSVLNRWLAMGIGLVCASPYFLWELLSPRPIDLSAHTDTVDYEFRDEAYADEFAILNLQAD
jgi:hypothetical protein